jgi:hypothetical protein
VTTSYKNASQALGPLGGTLLILLLVKPINETVINAFDFSVISHLSASALLVCLFPAIFGVLGNKIPNARIEPLHRLSVVVSSLFSFGRCDSFGYFRSFAYGPCQAGADASWSSFGTRHIPVIDSTIDAYVT